MPGPLAGTTIVEFAGLGPAPFCGMMLADQGAEVIVLHRPGAAPDPRLALSRSRKLVEVNLKSEEGKATALDLCARADGVIEGFRPGVLERLGLGPDVLLEANSKLVIGRMTGWGQTGPLAPAAGHDINYISIAGALHAYGEAGGKPIPPANMIGDFGGGGMMLAFGMSSALLHAHKTGEGQVIDCAMTDGTAQLMAMVRDFYNIGEWKDERGVNYFDGGTHFYNSYETSDGKWISIGPLEPQFYALFRETLNLSEDPFFDPHMDAEHWPEQKARLAELFLTRTRDEWCDLMEGTDICFAPILSLEEATQHPHNVARGTFVEVGGQVQPAPALRYSRTACDMPEPPKTA